MATQAVVGRAVHAPFAQDVPGGGCTQLQPQRAILHAVVHLGDFRTRLIRVRDQVQLHDASPLNVLSAEFVRRGLRALQYPVDVVRQSAKTVAQVGSICDDVAAVGELAAEIDRLGATRAFVITTPGQRESWPRGRRTPAR